MDSTRSVLSKLLESYVNESSFVYKGNTYTSSFGHYYCNGDAISKEDYHDARDAYDDTGIMNMVPKAISKDINDFIEEFDIDVEETNSDRKRGHIGKNIDNKLDSIMKDTGCDLITAKTYLSAIKTYTAGDDCYAEQVESLIKSLPPYQDSLLYRGMTFGNNEETYKWYLNDCKPGDTLSLRGPTSFSSSYKISRGFTNGSYNSETSKSVMIINSRNLTGPSINHLSTFPLDEQEILCSKDTRLEVQDKKVINGTVYVHVKEIPLEESVEVTDHYIGVEGSLHQDVEE